MSKLMRILVFFDLPVKTQAQRSAAAHFRNFLLKDGYYMVQYSVYARVCSGLDAVATHRARLHAEVPNHGAVRMLVVTERQYEAIDILLGTKVRGESPQQSEQCVLL